MRTTWKAFRGSLRSVDPVKNHEKERRKVHGMARVGNSSYP